MSIHSPPFQDLELLVSPFQCLENLPGFVHNATSNTALTMARKLEMDFRTSILGEFGCGAPTFAIQAGVFAQETHCVDLPRVINEVIRNIAMLPPKSQGLMKAMSITSGS